MLKLIYGPRKLHRRLNCENGTRMIPEHWEVFQRCYKVKLLKQPEILQQIREMAQQQTVTLITAAKSEDYNHVIVLKQVLEQG